MSAIIGQPIISSDDVLMDEWMGAAIDAPEVQSAVIEEVVIPLTLHEERLDKALVQCLAGWSRSHLAQIIDAGEVKLLNEPARVLKPSHRVRLAQVYRVILRPLASTAAFEPQAMDLQIVYEDSDLLIIDKTAGLVVHPAPGHWSGTLLNGLLHHHAGARVLARAGIVHRLDKDTSGLMMVAKSQRAVDALVAAIAKREVRREYLGLAHRHWQGPVLRVVQTDIGRDPKNRLRMAVVPSGRGKSAQTDVSCIASTDEATWVHCRLHSGRTHQIRVHMAHVGHPLLGDVTYGGHCVLGLQRQALHAWRLSLIHPVSQVPMSWTSMPPLDMRTALMQMGLGYNESLLPVP